MLSYPIATTTLLLLSQDADAASTPKQKIDFIPTRHMLANDMSAQRPTYRYVAKCRDMSPTCRLTCRDISKCVVFKYADICHDTTCRQKRIERNITVQVLRTQATRSDLASTQSSTGPKSYVVLHPHTQATRSDLDST